jgi:hypothetical protein
MFSVITYEVRWFSAGHIPGVIKDWHRNLSGLFREHETRTDHYLLLAGNEELGVKWREGKMEFKKKMADHGLVSIHRVTGVAELWKKWSFEIEKGDQTQDLLVSDPENWVAVSKKRFLQLFTINHDDQLIPHPGTFGKGVTVMVEVSDVELGGNRWWTFGVEFTVQNKEEITEPQELMEKLFMDFPDQKLAAPASFGYPKWIAGRLKT